MSPVLELAERQHADPAVTAIFDAAQRSLGFVPNMTRALAASPLLLQAHQAHARALARGAIRARTREKIAVLVAQVDGCDYCLSAHMSPGSGIPLQELEAARTGQSDDPKEAAILAFAHAVIVERGHVGDAVHVAQAAGLTDTELVEIVGLVSVNFFTNTFNIAFQTPIDFPLVRA